ncbi:MAG: hypothetical protein L6R40_008378, partial [Gallowayella cf. fulva]
MRKDLDYIINHVFFPPKLPQKDDSDDTKSAALIGQVLAALRSFQAYIPEQELPECIACIKMVGRMLELRDQVGGLMAEKLQETLRKMISGDILAMHIRSQNAGLIVRKSSEHFSFESFEISPTTEAVIGSKGRLRRCFPGPGVVIGQDLIADASFLEPLTELLAKLDVETPQEVLPIVKKAHSKVVESRDTVHPRFVTEMLTGILRAVGQPLDAARIYKHTRDDVLWKDALGPWRRSPLWLLLRVALQTRFMHSDEQEQHVRYKSFMLFFMTHVLERALEASLPSDTLFLMTAKISRRALKTGAVNGAAWLQYVEMTMGAVQQELLRRWKSVEKHPDPLGTQQNWRPTQLSFLRDAELRLSSLRPYLARVPARSASPSTCDHFASNCGRRISQGSSSLPDLSLLREDEGQTYLYLADLELWVQHSLDDWLHTNIECQSACEALARVIDNYASAASSVYADMPEDISLMLLTTMDLWVALDKCALHHYPLLHEYDPEFPPSLFEPLLLPKKAQMERLYRVEQHLAKRRNAAIPGFPPLFRSVDAKKSFAVRYFRQSPYHQELQLKVEAEATNERSRKISELAKERQRYQELINQSNGMSCQYISRWRKHQQVSKHSNSCPKCQVESKAKGLTIDVHEWPLPERDLQAKAAVFELDVPTIVSKWRDTTYSIIVDMLSVEPGTQTPRQGKGKQQKVYPLHSYAGLQKFVKSQAGRLQITSTTKPFVNSHYSHQKISQANETNICVNNGLNYSLYDSKKTRWTEELLGYCDVRKKCTQKLPAGQYRGLQYALSNTIHTSNEVNASQAECPETLTMHEFYAFGTLRSGHRLQWRNIARELTTRVLNFCCYETHALLTQAAWQVGPFSEGELCRESHADLEEEDFGKSLLSTLDDAIGTVEGNWQGAAAARTFIALATRLLSLSTCDVVRVGCCRFLQRARAISLLWTRELGQKLHEVQQEEELKILNARTLEMALTCHGTFDVDPHHLPGILQSDEGIAIVTECSIIVHDRCPAVTDDLPTTIKTLLRRYRRLSHILEPFLRKRILNVRNGLDSTISRLWTGYVPGSLWTALGIPSERWLVTETSGGSGLSSMLVHYNLLNGSLLVNGLPLTRLPHSYESHPTFRRLFGEKVLDVVPSTMSGMVFEARNEYFGHILFFGMHNAELIIRAKREQKVYELLPVHALDGDFPQAFVNDYAHWLDIHTGFVEWRPLLNAWTSTSQNWQMQPSSRGEDLLLCGSSRLIDLHTPTAKAVSTVLSPLESAIHIHVALNCVTEVLEVHLPRLKLDFLLRKGATQLESKQFRGMAVDANQSFGTLTGLVNKLVLRGVKDSSRSVIIPHGDVRFKPGGHHVRVHIDTSGQHLSYHLYHIDCQIGRLVDNGSLRSKLFKCYLHAVTAHCLTDELTGRTGTEEALSILASPSVRSFLSLDEVEIDLLVLLARLTPRRQYYPRHLRVMQEVEWETLSALSQHNSFCTLVRSIFDQATMFSPFHDQLMELPDAGIYGDRHLLERATIRDSAYRVHGFGAENHTTDHDVDYVARDYVSNSIREAQVYRIAKLTNYWSAGLRGCSQLLHEIESWGEPLRGCKTRDLFPLGYDTNWLDPPAKFFPTHWCALHAALSRSVVQRDKYRIMVFLSTLTYSQHAKLELIETLLAFATVPELRAIRLPDYDSFHLSHGFQPSKQRLVNLTEDRSRPFYSCPESNLPQLSYETFVDADERRRDEHQAAVEDCVGHFVDALIYQWPEANVCNPVGTGFNTYISVNEATEDARSWFQSWNRNAKFKEIISHAQDILDGLNAGDRKLQEYSYPQPAYRYRLKQSHVEFNDIMGRSAPSLPPAPFESLDSWVGQQDGDRASHGELKSLLVRLLSKSSGHHEERYAKDLWKSFDSLHGNAEFRLRGSSKALKPLLEEHLTLCRVYASDVYQTICNCLRAETLTTHRLACNADMWPRVSSTSLLQHLAADKRAALRGDWKRSLVGYGVAISTLQRAERLLTCVGNNQEMLSELINPGHQGWNPIDYPDWLLLEIENNILIRRVQAQIAQEMISPSSGTNSILQLNMGEGKSSVIVPTVAAALADGKKLVRVVVLKPLSTQMFHVLLKRLGGMLGRRIFHMPISRSIRLDVHKAKQIRNLCEECMRTGGVLLVQPEHLLSFELMGIERLLSGESELGNILIATQHWLEENSRDILDESDEILSVRFELVYTMGMQRAIELGPERWNIIEHVLGLVSRFVSSVLDMFPEGLEVGPVHPGSFPRIRILQPRAAYKLLEMVARGVCEAGLPGVPVWNLPQHIRAVLFRFLTDIDMDENSTKPLQNHVLAVESMRRSLLLLRGLIAGGVLAFALQQKRWRVNYGLDLSRTMLAVPYRAKDNPATRAEFSHPDAAIVLTCLSYYYGGLSDEQLYIAFEKLVLSDQAQEEYERWVQDAPELPSAFRQLTGINLSDPTQCSQMVFPPLRLAKGAIDFYMSCVVFPKEMKEFPHKLSSSGWDIARAKVHPTTGFSGTNDSRYILPLSINQCDLPPQLHTNAAVLDCLLQPENTFKYAKQESGKQSLDAESLLRIVIKSEPPVRVILDVGAQVLEWKNEEVARKWLWQVPLLEAEAVVYFDDRNDLSVLSRDGISESLMISPFAKQMDQCLLYLDEAHTRGTDLKLPTNYRAAVTLGPDLTKDRIVQ